MKHERWQRAFAQNDKDFKEIFGVKKEIFLKMHEILTTAREKRRLKGGPRPKSPSATSFSDPAILAGVPDNEAPCLRFRHL